MSPYLRVTPPPLEEPSVRPRLAVLVALGSLACGGGPGPGKPAPQSPQETLAQFLAAVKANVQTFRIELQRQQSCTVAFPIDLVRARSGGWLVLDPHLESVGTPRASCKS